MTVSSLAHNNLSPSTPATTTQCPCGLAGRPAGPDIHLTFLIVFKDTKSKRFIFLSIHPTAQKYLRRTIWRIRMNKLERQLVEAVDSMFHNDPEILGITRGKPEKETSHFFTFHHEYLRDLFSLKVADSLFFESLTSAFADIHSYKYLDDPLFNESMTKHLTAIGVPRAEIELACNAVHEILKEMRENNKTWNEKAMGWHQDLEGIRQVSQDFNTNRKHTNEPYTGGGFYPVMESLYRKLYRQFDKTIKEDSDVSPVQPEIKALLSRLAMTGRGEPLQMQDLLQVAIAAYRTAVKRGAKLSPLDVLANSGEFAVAIYNALDELRNDPRVKSNLQVLRRLPQIKNFEEFRDQIAAQAGQPASRSLGTTGGPVRRI